MTDQDLWVQFPRYLNPPTVRSLSLLFILQELGRRIEQIQKLEKLRRQPPETFQEELNTFFSLGHPYPQGNIFPNKLCFYCDILLQASRIGDSNLLDELSKMSAFILKTRSTLYSNRDTLGKDPLSASFFREFRKKLSAVFEALAPFLYEARTDENVLVKLLEQRKILEYMLGLGTIEALLRSFFPNGYVHLRTLISEGLTKRGFLPFLSKKEPLIDAIEWESLYR